MAEEKVCIIGIWHLGAVTSACLASLGYQVIGVDNSPDRVKELNRGVPPLFEPGLAELLSENVTAGRLQYTTDLETAVRQAAYVLFTFDTPVDEQDEVDLSELFETCERLAPHLAQGATFVISSQVPVGTCEELAAVIRRVNPQASYGIAYVPENLRLGQAIQRFLHPDMLIIGADDTETAERVERLLSPIEAPRRRVSLRTAEMTKHAINAFLATSISFINEIANLCEKVGADAVQVGEALRLDQRIGPRALLRPGMAFAGGTLARDLKALLHLAERYDYEGSLLRGVLAVNERQNGAILEKLREVHGSLKGLTVGVLGLTYKAGTSTMRRSAAMEIVASLISEGAKVKAFDPNASVEELPPDLGLEIASDAYEAAAGSDALLILTDWPEFQALDYDAVRRSMRCSVLLDANNTLDRDRITEMGFLYWGIGR
ncbi:MAG: UDP-glucose/GDP-mannose dehydrogenase family protein [Chloroflexi bacterium]|nr:UDP-glucose/GDP-mannose dehydrogenase family protein [Chloroflexota bacterium]